MSKPYDKLQRDFLGLEPWLAYHCNRCDYRWLPNIELLEYDQLSGMKPPKSCARCKSRYWRSERKRKTKVIPTSTNPIRINPLLKSGKLVDTGLAAFLLGHRDQKEYQELMNQIQKDMPPKKFAKFKEIVSKRYASKPLKLETFNPPT